MIRISQYDETPTMAVYYHTKYLPHTDFFKHPEGYQVLTFLEDDFDMYGNPWDQEYYDDFDEHVFKDIEEIEDVVKTTYPGIKEIKKYPEEF